MLVQYVAPAAQPRYNDMIKRLAFLTILLAFAFTALSQPRNNAVRTNDLSLRLPARLSDLSLFDSSIHFVSNGMLLASRLSSPQLSSPLADTLLFAIDPQLTYAVRDPFSSSIYFTKSDSKGHSQLFEYYEKKPGKFATRKVKLPGLSSSVYHPVFSSDGRAMVFVSDSPLGFGGTDLWFALRNGKDWLSPQNMGHMLNSGGDEIMPSVYGDFLLFASNGRADSRGGFDLYAARLVAITQGDTVSMYPIGRCPAVSLEAPFCSKDDDLAIVSSGDLSSGWWLRRTADSSETFCHFRGRLDCVCLRGIISSSLYDRVGGAYAVAAFSPREGAAFVYDTVRALADGSYCLFLRTGIQYEVSYYAENHFVTTQEITPARKSEERLYAEMVNDVRLSAISLDSLMFYPALFSSSVSSELSPSGRAFVDKIALFLIQNPSVGINIYSAYNLSADIPFCSLLNGSRLKSLSEYLVSKGVPKTAISTATTIPSELKRKSNLAAYASQKGLSPVAQSSLTVSFSLFSPSRNSSH